MSSALLTGQKPEAARKIKTAPLPILNQRLSVELFFSVTATPMIAKPLSADIIRSVLLVLIYPGFVKMFFTVFMICLLIVSAIFVLTASGGNNNCSVVANFPYY